MHATLADAIALGLVVPDGDDFIVTSPTFLEAGAELVASGVPLTAVLDVVRKTRRAAEELSEAFVSMFMEYVWKPFVAAGEPEDRLDEIVDAINRQRPLATNVVIAALGQAMQDRVDQAVMRSVAETPDTETG
jgi:hypothetical protein